MSIPAKSFVLLLIVSVGCAPALAQRRNPAQKAVAPNCFHKEEEEKDLVCASQETARQTTTQVTE